MDLAISCADPGAAGTAEAFWTSSPAAARCSAARCSAARCSAAFLAAARLAASRDSALSRAALAAALAAAILAAAARCSAARRSARYIISSAASRSGVKAACREVRDTCCKAEAPGRPGTGCLAGPAADAAATADAAVVTTRTPAATMMVCLLRFRLMIRSRDKMTLRSFARHGSAHAPRDSPRPWRPYAMNRADGRRLTDLARVRAPGRIRRPSRERDADDHQPCLISAPDIAQIACDINHARVGTGAQATQRPR